MSAPSKQAPAKAATTTTTTTTTTTAAPPPTTGANVIVVGNTPTADAEVDEAVAMAELERYHSAENFCNLHSAQFTKMGLPQKLWRRVHAKLYGGEYDATDSFAVQFVEDEGKRRLACAAEEGLKKEADVWVIDHAWTVQPANVKRELLEVEGLLDRFWDMMNMEHHLAEEAAFKKRQEAKAAEEKKFMPAVKPGFLAGKNGLGSAGAPLETKSTKSSTPYVPDEDTVSMLAEQHSVTVEIARAALLASDGDAITASGKIEDALEAAGGKPVDVSTLMAREAEAQLNQQFEETLRNQPGFANEKKAVDSAPAAASPATPAAAPATATPTPAPVVVAAAPAPVVEEEPVGPRGASMTPAQRVDAVCSAMFTYRYAQTYFTAKPRTDAPVTTLNAADVDTCVFVHDEIGSAVRVVSAGAANARLEPLIVLTQNGVGFSLLWLTHDVDIDDTITRAPFPIVRPTAAALTAPPKITTAAPVGTAPVA